MSLTRSRVPQTRHHDETQMVQGCDVLSWMALRETAGAFWASAVELRV